MFEMIPLVLQGVEGLVLNLPTRPPATHDCEDVHLGDGEIGDPTEVLGLALSDLPVLDKVHQYVRIGLVQGYLIDKGKAVNLRPSDTIPTSTTFASADSGGSLVGDQVRWTDKMVDVDGSLMMHFTVRVDSLLPNGALITNDNYGVKCIQMPAPVMGTAITTTVTIKGWQIYLPVVVRNHTPGG
jgi:hypothetical protein